MISRFRLKSNSFIAIGVSFSKGNTFNTLTLNMYSEQITREILCPCCNGSVHIYDRHEKQLRDMPLDSDCYQTVHVNYHRYRCLKCGHTFSEKIPFQYLGTRITERAARFVKSLLNHGMTIKSVSEITGIHWDTIRKIHLEEMQSSIKKSDMLTRQDGYKPRYLAVDEFAVHKGHKYATCVLDLERGDVIWVGSGRAMADFRRFFEEIDMEYLSEVKAVAMDMNASYNNLVTEYMPNAAIVYDRYHMQAQYGKDVLGSVRLAEAKKHQIHAKEIDNIVVGQTDRNIKKQLRAEAKTERHLYSKVKGARWTLLKKNSSLTEEASEELKEILNKHEDLAVCYAMKEEMIQIYSIKDPEEALKRWTAWFEAAKSSNIPQLIKFATQKEKRIAGLVSHALYPINTGKLEGLNNKIKVAKRLAYGYRDDSYFFTLIRYFTLPSHTFP